MPSLATRHRVPELMDDPAIDPAEHRQALAGLARLNGFNGAAAALWPSIRQLAHTLQRPIRVLDVATGSGDIPIRLFRQAQRAKLPLEIAGCDLSPTAIAVANDRVKQAGVPIAFFEQDVLQSALPDGFDIVTCSLFLHHLDDADAVLLLQQMKAAARHQVLICDLSRSRWNLGLVWLASRIVSRSQVVHFDGPASVRAAFTMQEVRTLAESAGLPGAVLKSHYPCRFLLSWTAPR